MWKTRGRQFRQQVIAGPTIPRDIGSQFIVTIERRLGRDL
jgi:hypothetical protein